MDSGILGLEKTGEQGKECLVWWQCAKRGGKNNVVLHLKGTSHMRAGGYEKFERKKGIKEDEVERWCIASTDAH